MMENQNETPQEVDNDKVSSPCPRIRRTSESNSFSVDSYVYQHQCDVAENSNNCIGKENENDNGEDGDDDVVPAFIDDGEYSYSLSSAGETPTGESTYSSVNNPSMITDQASAPSIASRENHLVTWSRAMVFMVLIYGACAVAVTVYKVTKREQQESFREKFDDFAAQVINEVHVNSQRLRKSLHSTTVLLSNANSNNPQQDWPFVSMGHFESQIDTMLLQEFNTSLVAVVPFVNYTNLPFWETYSSGSAAMDWISQGLEYRGYVKNVTSSSSKVNIFPYLYNQDNKPISTSDMISGESHESTYTPIWQYAPLKLSNNDDNDFESSTSALLVNYDLSQHDFFQALYHYVTNTREPTISKILNNADKANGDEVKGYMKLFREYYEQDDIYSAIASPIFASNNNNDNDGHIVGLLLAFQSWKSSFLQHLLPDSVSGIQLVVSNSCDQVFTFQVDGSTTTFLGAGDLHDKAYSDWVYEADFNHAFWNTKECFFTIQVYPTSALAPMKTKSPVVYASTVIVIFFLTTMIFVFYDCIVEKRQEKVISSARKTNAIVNSLFPATVRDRLMKHQDDPNSDAFKANIKDEEASYKKKKLRSLDGVQFPMIRRASKSKGVDSDTPTSMMLNIIHAPAPSTSKPIADLFPRATVLFADIVGFTAWSSTREPSQVFTLLESVYNTFDNIANKLGVFKVETIGDCYVAATGLPDPRDDHAVVMVRFAKDCLFRLNQIVHHLETTLGPDTSDLDVRIGINSGPVTAGVLRGQKSRFQLFGDTVNVASRMESTGMASRIQVSQDTADLIVAANKESWIYPRENTIDVKGKGAMQTYWVRMTAGKAASTASRSSVGSYGIPMPQTTILSRISSMGIESLRDEEKYQINERTDRLIEWNVEVLEGLLKKIVAMRKVPKDQSTKKQPKNHLSISHHHKGSFRCPSGATVLDEVTEVIVLPSQPEKYRQDPDFVVLKPQVKAQLYDYVKAVANMYNNNDFHSFEHASHVVQSVYKLMSRIVASQRIDYKDLCYKTSQAASNDKLHKYTFGITSDPLTQFACVFSALIHDVDHPGVPNAQLIKEQADIAVLYKNKSVAEQNSVDLAWELLMEPCYTDLRHCIYSNSVEMDRFRQLVVNSVMATDIVDKELGALRKKRWDKAFKSLDSSSTNSSSTGSSRTEDANRKATIVIEHLIQASDVSHVMQHWHVYLKWNHRYFNECYKAYREGRAEHDPSENWYQGELGFFDFYIIPLAKKLKECQVFGVSSDEYLNYALANRKEWELKGEGIVKKYLSYQQQLRSESTE